MKRLMKCRLCGGTFEQEFYFEHVCPQCLVDEADEKPAPEPVKPQGKEGEDRP